VIPMLVASRGTDRVRAAFEEATVLGSLCVLPMLAVIGLHGDWLAGVLFGEGFRIPIATTASLTAAAAVQVCGGPNAVLLVAARKHGSLILVGSSLVAVNLILNIALVPRLGMFGGAIASLVCVLLLNVGYTSCLRGEFRSLHFILGLAWWQAGFATALVVAAGLPRQLLGPGIPAIASSLILCAAVVGAASFRGRGRNVTVTLLASVVKRGALTIDHKLPSTVSDA